MILDLAASGQRRGGQRRAVEGLWRRDGGARRRSNHTVAQPPQREGGLVAVHETEPEGGAQEPPLLAPGV